MTAAAAAQLAIAMLPLVKTGVAELIAFIQSCRSAAMQAGEWTDVQEAAYRAALWACTGDPAYQPDPKG